MKTTTFEEQHNRAQLLLEKLLQFKRDYNTEEVDDLIARVHAVQDVLQQFGH